MTIKYYPDLVQGSNEWLYARLGILTASEVKKIITPTLKVAANEETRIHLYELLAQRLNEYVEPQYVNDDMLRGNVDEVEARILYGQRYAAVSEMGFITNDEWGFPIGFSPDGLVDDEGFIECKSRGQKHQAKTLVECLCEDTVPKEYILQIMTGFLVSKRKWCDFLSYCGGMPMIRIRVYPDPKIMDAIVNAAMDFEAKLQEKMARYKAILKSHNQALTPTERRVEQEIVI